jgi:hypothetical protein
MCATNQEQEHFSYMGELLDPELPEGDQIYNVKDLIHGEAIRVVKWLISEASLYLSRGADYSGPYPNGKIRTLVELCDTVLVALDGNASDARIAYLRLIQSARAILEEGSEDEEAETWLGFALRYILRMEALLST